MVRLLMVVVGLVVLAMLSAGCAVGWQINMPGAYSQAHSRGTSYNAASGKEMSPEGTTEAFQQQRAVTATGDALGTSVDQDKATDLAAAKGQSAVTTETAKAQDQGTGTASGPVSADSAPTKTTSVAPSVSVAPGGAAITSSAAPAASPGDASAGAAPAPAKEPTAEDIAALEEAVAAAEKAVTMFGSGGNPDGSDTAEQAKAKAALASMQARLEAARRKQ